ncbi:3-hydroxyisobutyryl-CoA hydrolase, mitochondrial-like [Vespa mandarinia]|uniref:3-hydroxyisobutyryl-CoA hydrolase, mitochondrial-like n=1 Tax=Vespa mandarinia TaxID=7446 RepID=UPI00160A1E36|nr:3-hydroxyisobutyryl-CoA hydrolase, mitochondrial-like [Vespa mandarinia]XP_035728306.1 3-hydroxyisobutyryl-CoA hydrolase, mitochondrial-like [Vespa mandarinia]
MLKMKSLHRFDIRRMVHKTCLDLNKMDINQLIAQSKEIWENSFWGGCDNDILIKDYQDNGLFTINRPKTLNTLTPGICNIINETLQKWNHNKKLVIIEGSGDKAFCSGGYLRMPLSYQYLRNDDYDWHKTQTFQVYYSMSYYISTLKVPFIALMNNLTMGLGSAISLQAKYRIVTERSLYAMPEVLIGYFPDSSSCYTFPRLQNHIGYFLGVTGYRLKGSDIVHSGIASHFVPSEKLEDLKNELLKSDNSNIEEIINKYHVNTSKNNFGLNQYIDIIENCFSAPTVEEILERLEKDNTKWSRKIIEIIKAASPTSLKSALLIIQKGKDLDLADCARMDCRMGHRLLSQGSDIFEGINTTLYEKDRKPRWNPAHLEDVSMDKIKHYLSNLPPEKELKL